MTADVLDFVADRLETDGWLDWPPKPPRCGKCRRTMRISAADSDEARAEYAVPKEKWGTLAQAACEAAPCWVSWGVTMPCAHFFCEWCFPKTPGERCFVCREPVMSCKKNGPWFGLLSAPADAGAAGA